VAERTTRSRAAAKAAPRTRATRKTDLENFVAAAGRAAKVRDVRKQINASGVEYIYYQFPSVTGRIMGKGVPAKHWESIAQKGFQLVYGATANLFTDRHGEYIGYGPEAPELVGIPEPETFAQLPWDPKVARVWCTLFRNREERDDPGAFLTSDCRGNLHRIQAAFEAKTGLHLRAGTEPEMMWLKQNPDGTPSVEGMSKPYCYHIDQFSEFQPLIHKVMEYAEGLGLDMIQGDHEDAPGQLELNWMYDTALRTADRLSTYRQICAAVGREFDLIPCFMSKPYMGVSASGCHHNVSLWREGEDEINTLGQSNPMPGMDYVYSYLKGGENTFMPLKGQRKPGPIGLMSIGGVIEHLPALTAIGCSTVNSYRRLWDAGFWAPVYADWGYQNRTCGLRISAPGRFEYRAVDSMVNPYLMAGAIYKAFDDGIKRKLDPGEPESRNIYEAMEQGKQVHKLPMNLGDALNALAHDDVIRSAMPDEMYRVFHHYKNDEWERFLGTTTEWDMKTYWDCLP
jgi:glutamine synthetase